jgi:hypothetical protein
MARKFSQMGFSRADHPDPYAPGGFASLRSI